MLVQREGPKKKITIDPGEYHVSSEPIIMSTLLGSCVAACLFDPVHRIFGMNHFLLANKRYTQGIPVLESEAGRYGIHAMELLINQMVKMGAQRPLIKAKVFGGGDVLHHHRGTADNFFLVGEVNSRFVREFLRQENIPILAADLGKDYGRVIYFSGADFSVYMRRIEHTKDSEIASQERQFWQKSILEHERQEQQKNSVHIW